jgi:hypothetical protein
MFAAAGVLGIAGISGPARAGSLFLSQLDGSQQVPPVPTPATGSAITYLSADQTMGHIKLWVRDLTSPVVAAHIHYGPGGQNGPTLYDLGPFTDSTEVDFGPIAPNILPSLLSGNTYVNVHTVNYLAGEIRGQLVPQASVSLTAYLNATQEVPPTGSSATGFADLTLWPDHSRLHIDLTVTNFIHTITDSHIHHAPPGQNGPVVFAIGPFTSRAIKDLAPTEAEAQDLLAGQDYVNVHSNVDPGGEIRGQIEVYSPASVPGPAVPAAPVTFTAWPNPMRESATLVWTVRGLYSAPGATKGGSAGAPSAAGSRSSVEIFDASGRRVRALAVPDEGLGEGSVVWDGRDVAARPVPGGVYYARLTIGGSAQVLRSIPVVVLR